MNYSGECGINDKSNNNIFKATAIEYFEKNNIKIDKIYNHILGERVFYLSNDNILYGSGSNMYHEMGWNQNQIKIYEEDSYDDSTEFNNYEPTECAHPDLGQNIIDIQCSRLHSVALCSMDNKQSLDIIKNWSREYSVPSDIIIIMVSFCKSFAVYSTTKRNGSGHPYDAILQNKYGWNKIIALENENIIQIAICNRYSLFLSNDGNVWICGVLTDFDEVGQDLDIPQRIKYFMENKIKIIDIHCGQSHAMAMDDNGNIYSWGDNNEGQCGIDNDCECVTKPTLIESLKKI